MGEKSTVEKLQFLAEVWGGYHIGDVAQEAAEKMAQVDVLIVHEAGDLGIEELVIKLYDLNKALEKDDGT